MGTILTYSLSSMFQMMLKYCHQHHPYLLVVEHVSDDVKVLSPAPSVLSCCRACFVVFESMCQGGTQEHSEAPRKCPWMRNCKKTREKTLKPTISRLLGIRIGWSWHHKSRFWGLFVVSGVCRG